MKKLSFILFCSSLYAMEPPIDNIHKNYATELPIDTSHRIDSSHKSSIRLLHNNFSVSPSAKRLIKKYFPRESSSIFAPLQNLFSSPKKINPNEIPLSITQDAPHLFWYLSLMYGTHCFLRGHEGSVVATALDSEAYHAVTGTSNSRVFIWNIKNACLVDRLNIDATLDSAAIPSTINSIATNMHGTTFIATSDHKLRIWDIHAKQLHILPMPYIGQISHVALSSSSEVSASFLKELFLVQQATDITIGESVIDCITLEDGSTLKECSNLHYSILGQPVKPPSLKGYIFRLFTRDGKYLLLTSGKGSALYDIQTHKIIKCPLIPADIQSLQISINKKALYTIKLEGRTHAYLYDINDATQRELGASTQEVTATAINPLGSYACLGYLDGIVEIWNLSNSAEYIEIQLQSGRINALSINAKGRYLLIGTAGETAFLYDLYSIQDELTPNAAMAFLHFFMRREESSNPIRISKSTYWYSLIKDLSERFKQIIEKEFDIIYTD